VIKIPNLSGLMTIGKGFIMAHRPEMLFGASVTATLGAVALAAKGGYDAGVKVERTENTEGRILDTKEKIQLTWLCYMPAAITTVTAIGSTTGLHIVHVKEKKALAQAALAAIDEVKQQAKEFERENLGILSEEEKQDVLDKRSDEDGRAIIQNSDGEIEELYLVRDAKTGRDIWSNERRIEDAVIEVNRAINKNGDAELDFFYTHAGFNDIPDGNMMGWSGEPIGLKWTTDTRDDGRPVRVFAFQPEPKKGFDDTHA
jgi:hypothetical protein